MSGECFAVLCAVLVWMAAAHGVGCLGRLDACSAGGSLAAHLAKDRTTGGAQQGVGWRAVSSLAVSRPFVSSHATHDLLTSRSKSVTYIGGVAAHMASAGATRSAQQGPGGRVVSSLTGFRQVYSP